MAALRLVHIVCAEALEEALLVVVDRQAHHLVLALKLVFCEVQLAPPTSVLDGVVEQVVRVIVLRPASVRTL